MDPDLLLIFGFILVMVILATRTAHLIHRRTIRHDERKLELKAEIEQARALQTTVGNADFRKFEERIRVLERIATDSNHALASQIEELRDLQEIEDRTAPQEYTQ